MIGPFHTLDYVKTNRDAKCIRGDTWCCKDRKIEVTVNSLASASNYSQVIKYLEVRVLNPQRLCLYLDWCKPNLQARDKEFKIIDKER